MREHHSRFTVIPRCAAYSLNGRAPMVTLSNRNTDESPCSPMTHAWMLRGWTSHSVARRSPKRRVSSDVPDPMIETSRPTQRRTRYSVSTSSGLVTTMTTPWEAAGLHGAGRVVEDLHVGAEHVEAGLPRLDVVAARDDHHVFGFELVVAPPADLRAREQRQRVQVVERLAPGPDPGAVVQRDPPGEPRMMSDPAVAMPTPPAPTIPTWSPAIGPRA